MVVKVSVIMPCYNTGDILLDTLKSLECQTFKDFELLCINDGSTDNSLCLLEEYRKKTTMNMRIINKQNSGVSDTRNIGIIEAIGEYVLFVDSDDIVSGSFIEALYCSKVNANVDISYCLYSRNLGIPANQHWNGEYQNEDVISAMDKLMYKMNVLSFCCYIYKKSVLIDNKIKFDVNTKHFEDREFNWKYLCHCKTAAFIPLSLYGYRVVLTSASNSAVWRTDSLEAVKRIESYMSVLNCPYLYSFKNFMYSRVIWGIAKKYAAGNRMDNFDRLKKEYDVMTSMKIQSHNKQIRVKFLSYTYLINPYLFYYTIKILSYRIDYATK